jgi:hypothetical protein
MNFDEFSVRKIFWCGDRKWLCTDIGTRIVVAICLDDLRIIKCGHAASGDCTAHQLTRETFLQEGWLYGPPYAVAETVFDEDDQ